MCVCSSEQAENVSEDILKLGHGVNAVEIDLMEPIDPEKAPRRVLFNNSLFACESDVAHGGVSDHMNTQFLTTCTRFDSCILSSFSVARRVHLPALNHIGLWVHPLPECVEWLTRQGMRFAPGGIRKGAAGHDVAFIHPKGDKNHPLCGEGVLIELVQAPPDVVALAESQ